MQAPSVLPRIPVAHGNSGLSADSISPMQPITISEAVHTIKRTINSYFASRERIRDINRALAFRVRLSAMQNQFYACVGN